MVERPPGSNRLNIVNWQGEVSLMTLMEQVSSINNGKNLGLIGSEEDIGGPFFVLRKKCIQGPTGIAGSRRYALNPMWDIEEVWEGTEFLFQAYNIQYPPPINSDESDLKGLGTEAIAKAAPGTAPNNLTNTLIELKREGLPSIIGSTFKSRSSIAKKAGDEYLNVQFGWKPLVNDVMSLAKTVTNADDILLQLERDAGRRVRRRVTLHEGWETISSEDIGMSNPNMSGYSGYALQELYPPSNLRLTVRQYRKVWFSGSFTYYLPPDYYSRDVIKKCAAETRLLTGLELTPTVLWNAAPWSWAADWFSNAGDVISNTQRFLSEGLVMHHGYIMEHTVHEYTYSAASGTLPDLKLITETKGRMKANPFGFDVDWPDLSDFQLSIIAALGFSRRG